MLSPGISLSCAEIIRAMLFADESMAVLFKNPLLRLKFSNRTNLPNDGVISYVKSSASVDKQRLPLRLSGTRLVVSLSSAQKAELVLS